MPMGVISDDELEAELESERPANNNSEQHECNVIDINRGRGQGNTEVPAPLRNVIGEEAITRTTTLKELARIFDVSPASVSAYKNGATSTASYNRPDTQLSKHVDSVKDKIKNKAQARILLAMSHITAEKVEAAKLRDIAGLARDMSAVIKNMEDSKGQGNTNITYQIYAPRERKESDYEIVEAGLD